MSLKCQFHWCFWGEQIAPKRGNNSKIFSSLALQGWSSGRCSPLEGSFTPKMPTWGTGGAGLEVHGEIPALLHSLGVPLLPPPNQSLSPHWHWGHWCWVFVQWSSFPQSIWEGKSGMNSRITELLNYWMSCSQPRTTHVSRVVHEPQFHRKDSVGSDLGWQIRYSLKYSNPALGVTSVTETAKIPSLEPVLPIWLIWPQNHTAFTGSCLSSHLLFFFFPLPGVCNET